MNGDLGLLLELCDDLFHFHCDMTFMGVEHQVGN